MDIDVSLKLLRHTEELCKYLKLSSDLLSQQDCYSDRSFKFPASARREDMN